MVNVGSSLAQALKEDPESAEAPPDARPSSHTPPVSPGVSAPVASQISQGHTGSTASEVVEAYNELVEFALLISNENAMFDVKEAHLAFKRSSSAPAIDSGMPTLRRFIRPSDWDRMEKMFDTGWWFSWKMTFLFPYIILGIFGNVIISIDEL